LTFILVVTGALIVGVGRNLFRDYQNYFVIYHDGHGLLPGVKVRFLGIDIGNVTRVELTENDKIRMELKILTEYAGRVKGDSLAVIKSPTLIGSEYIEIQSGSLESIPIPHGGQIPAKDPKTIDEVVTALKLEQKLVQFEGILADVAALSHKLQDRDGPLMGTMENFREISHRMLQGDGTLGSIISRDEAYKEIISTLKELRNTSESLSASAKILNKDIPNLTVKIDTILKEIEGGTRSFPEVARSTREGLRDVHQVLDSAKRNFLIRGNLSSDPPPESLVRPLRDR
jgi:phospholipid/cholesterol/gamma-HCH transport system substrate-binding protein